jgi:predicted phosphodiesterase
VALGAPAPPVRACTQPPALRPELAAADPAPRPGPWTLAVMSDIHMPRRDLRVDAELTLTIAAIVALRPRLVVITGDHTNGGERDSPETVAASAAWWRVLVAQLRPLRDAGIPVLPVAGNHDAYLAGQRAHYAAAFRDLEAWAAPLAIRAAPRPAGQLDQPPFSYSVRVDGVHLALAHVVTQGLHREVAAWLERDLAAAADAQLRLVFGHVPIASVIQPPHRGLVAQLGGILERGRAAAYIAGHEHVVWDEDVPLPGGGALRQILVGCASGIYNWPPSAAARRRAGCAPRTAARPFPLRCRMPNGGGAFELAPNRVNRGRVIQHQLATFTLITVAADRGILEVAPMAADAAGRAQPFYLPPQPD